ncbi:MAG: TAXI family TRAP transporter solute-binding subunit [Desulfobacterales bacterium]|nr:TAXI family TRAP transporter solute-binding subunit [Desulfobacterales bacterium]
MKIYMKIFLCFFIITFFVGTLPKLSIAAGTDEQIGIATGNKTGTYYKFGLDIAKVAKSVGIDIIVKESEGSINNIQRLTSSENIALAIIQSDTIRALKRYDDPGVRKIVNKLRIVFPLYEEEVHVLANKKIKNFQQLEGKRIILGNQGSGNWLIANNLLDIAGITPVPHEKMYLNPPDAVEAVLLGEADVMFYVVGKPAKLFININKLQKKYSDLVKTIHFIPLDSKMFHAEGYVTSEIRSEDYTWLGKDMSIPTIAVKAVLISYDFSEKKSPYYQMRCYQLSQVAQAIRDHIKELRQTGHPKWHEINLDEKIEILEKDSCSFRSSTLGSYPNDSQSDFSKELLKILTGKE